MKSNYRILISMFFFGAWHASQDVCTDEHDVYHFYTSFGSRVYLALRKTIFSSSWQLFKDLSMLIKNLLRSVEVLKRL